MWPRLVSRGRMNPVGIRAAVVAGASMWPRLASRGRLLVIVVQGCVDRIGFNVAAAC